MSLVKTVGRNGVEDLYCRGGYSLEEIAIIYEVSMSSLYGCLRQLYGSDWKKVLSTRKEEYEVKADYEERIFCAAL